MAVAWIGSREELGQRAVEQAAALLRSSRCPVFSIDTDVHGTRAAIALAEQVGAAYDHVDAVSAALARETALFTGKGGMFVSPGEVRRRSDVVVIVGELPESSRGLLVELARTVPDQSTGNPREFFLIGDDRAHHSPLGEEQEVTRLSCREAGLAATVAALRAQLAGRQVATEVSNFERFAGVLATARFPVFIFSGLGCDELVLEMLQGLIGDLNRKSRASGLHLPASDNGWGSMLASTWSTGLAPRTGFARGFPEFDPWRFDVARSIADGEADLHLWICARPDRQPAKANGTTLIALTRTTHPVADAAVTIAVGEAGIDHNAVVYSSRTGTLASVPARSPSELPSAVAILRSISAELRVGAPSPC